MAANLRSSRDLRWIAALCCVFVVLTVLASVAVTGRTPHAGAAVFISPDDPMMSVPRGTPEKALRFAQENKSTNFAESRAYIYEIYRLAPLVGLDPALVVAQSAHETGNWTSFYWTNHLNPAGIGIGYSGAPSYTWASGTNAARFHLVRLYIYVAGALDPGNPLYPYREDGPSYQRVIDLKYNGQIHVLNDLTGRWATDPNYGQNVANRGNQIYSFDPGDPTEPALQPISVGASSGNNPYRTYDGDLSSSWAVQGIDTPPPGGYVTYDFGQPVVLQSIQWMFRRAGSADAYRIQISTDGASWTDLDSFAEPTAWTWLIFEGSVTTNYIRFLFENPNADLTIGYLCEVEFYGQYLNSAPTSTSTPYPPPTATNTPVPTATSTSVAMATNTPSSAATSTATFAVATQTPTATPAALSGQLLPIVGSGGSGGCTWTGYVRDGNIRTTWQTLSDTPPRRAQVYVDLGRSTALSGVEFVFRRTSGARHYEIRVSDDKKSWTTVATFTYADPLVWQRASISTTGRYVQFLFTNTTGARSLGYLADVRVYGYPERVRVSHDSLTPTATSTTPATTTSTPPPVVIDLSPVVIPTDIPPTETATPVEVIEFAATATPAAMIAGSPVPIDDSLPITEFRRSTSSTTAAALVDGDRATTWESSSDSPASIYVIADLGELRRIGAVEWLPSPSGISGQMHVEVHVAGSTWETIDGAFAETAGEWQMLPINRDTSAVRIVVTNPGGADSIGGVAELRIRASDEP